MKKLATFLVLVALALFTSCSSDTDAAKSEFKATINGEPHTFNTLNVDKEQYDGYTDVIITASIDSDPSKIITIIIEEGVIGADASWYFTYFLDDTAHEKVHESFATDITESSSNRVKGNFSGTVLADDGSGASYTITNGTFDVRH